jgi:threonine/homoserine/homoserine lactone efflux protein
MMPGFFWEGVGIGFSIAAPVGPIGILCIRRSLAYGRRMGLATGLGAASADAAYGCVAGFGITAVSRFLVGEGLWLRAAGGLFLCYLGVRTFVGRPSEGAAESREGGLRMAYLSTLVLTLANPITILSFAAVFAGLGLGSSPEYSSASALVAGVFLGSALWWLILSCAVGTLRSRTPAGWMLAVNRISGAAILAFGLYLLGSLVSR